MGEWLELLEGFFGFWRFTFSSSFRRRKIAKWKQQLQRPVGWIMVPAEIIGGLAGVIIPIGVVYWLATQSYAP